jgi:acetoin utilization deacetylase AcuC-like enzyme
MGFCMISNVAVVAASLADEGERVMILDYDAHHGNGTQAVFYDDPRVLFVSYHQWPLYPGTGRVVETGIDAGAGTTLNIPLPAGTTGDVYLRAFDEIVAPVAERFAPTWVIVSAGFDAHRDDPLTNMGLAAGDYGPLTARALALVPAGRRLVMLEGGYDLHALTSCSSEVMRELAGVSATGRAPVDGAERATSAGPGSDAVDAVVSHWQQQGWL